MTLTVWFLQASRSIRTVWLVEELGIKDYDFRFADRENRKAPEAFKKECGNPLGKFPTIRDGDVIVYESGAIAEYLCETYDTSHRLVPAQQPERSKVQMWIHASEGTFMMHALPAVYAKWFVPDSVSEEDVAAQAKGMSANIAKDLDWVQQELEQSSGKFLVGNSVTAADIMMHFSVSFILTKKIGTNDKTWPRLEQWVRDCEATPSYQRALEKSGHKLEINL